MRRRPQYALPVYRGPREFNPHAEAEIAALRETEERQLQANELVQGLSHLLAQRYGRNIFAHMEDGLGENQFDVELPDGRCLRCTGMPREVDLAGAQFRWLKMQATLAMAVLRREGVIE